MKQGSQPSLRWHQEASPRKWHLTNVRKGQEAVGIVQERIQKNMNKDSADKDGEDGTGSRNIR